MPYFVFCGHDRPGVDEARIKTRESHRAYLRVAQDGCRCVAGGPLMDDAGVRMIGTLLVFEARDKTAVEKFLSGDPYADAGIFAHSDIWNWNWGFGQPRETGV